MNNNTINTVVLGGTGYVAGELLRLIAGHPNLNLTAVASDSQAGVPIRQVFPNLQQSFGEQAFVGRDELAPHLTGRVALFSAAPHGVSAGMIADVLALAESQGAEVSVVDASADFRFSTNDAFKAVYTHDHGAQDLLSEFTSAVPEHLAASPTPHVGHPGCFATALMLAAVPMLKLGLAESELFATGVTGSTGSGRTPTAGTHHPVRHSNMYAYKPLSHRHSPEVANICEAMTGTRPKLNFIPHSGPFARGIHMTVQAKLAADVDTAGAREQLAAFYADAPFVEVVDGLPRIKDVAGSNYAHLGVAVEDGTIAVFSAIDNLLKGAAGGSMQWMNRLLGLPETAGLDLPGPAWI